ncbi:MAG: hypothetical protein VYD94_01455 [Thermoproteota archaeon]|nr:hypothetical protein [Thermoproteota archaeon]
MQKTDDFTRACEEIVQNLLNIDNLENNKIKNEIKAVCTKYSLERIPRNNEILSMVNPTDFKKLQNILLTKPVKSASGVAVVAIMPKPFACPHGRCSYCPGVQLPHFQHSYLHHVSFLHQAGVLLNHHFEEIYR